MFMVAPRTAKKWADRYRAEARPGWPTAARDLARSPTKTSPEVVRQIVRLRWRQRLGPVQIARPARHAGLDRHAVLVRCRINRLSHIDRVTGEPLRRYEHDHPGSLIHVDVTKFGNIPDGGGLALPRPAAGQAQPRSHRRPNGAAGPRTRAADRDRLRAHRHRRPLPASPTPRSAPTRRPPPRSACCSGPSAWFADHGVTVERVLSDNGAAYSSYAWRDACADLGITHKRTRPYRPQTNGKIERFHRTLADGWAYARFYELNRAAQRRPARLAPLLQSPPRPLRHRRPATGHPADQPPWTSH